MDQNNNKKPDGGKNSNWRGFIHLICWAVLLAVLVSYATTYMTSMGHQASSVELEYSVFLDMLDFGKVAGVDFDNSESILIITPADGYIYTDEEGIEYTKTTFERPVRRRQGRRGHPHQSGLSAPHESDCAVPGEFGSLLYHYPGDEPGNELDGEKGHGRHRGHRRRG